MNVYVETNFVLELAFMQEQHQSCENILDLCADSAIGLVLPAYCLVEPYETLIRRHNERKKLTTDLDMELKQLTRTLSYAQHASASESVLNVLTTSANEESRRLEKTRARLIGIAEIIPLEKEILTSASDYRATHDLSPQDSIVCASVIDHLDRFQPEISCFLNRNSHDFDDPDIVAALEERNCKMLPQFDAGYSYIRNIVVKMAGY